MRYHVHYTVIGETSIAREISGTVGVHETIAENKPQAHDFFRRIYPGRKAGNAFYYRVDRIERLG
jgi:hypothetical protein